MGRKSRQKKLRTTKPPKDPIRFAVGVQVATYRETLGSDNDAIRRKILDHAKGAMEREEGQLKVMTFDGKSTEMVDAPTIFLLAFARLGLDHRDARVQETLFERIGRTIDQVFSEGY